MTNRQILTESFENGYLVFFKMLDSNFAEKYVKVVKIQSDDVLNKEFTIETQNGDRYTYFENNIIFI